MGAWWGPQNPAGFRASIARGFPRWISGERLCPTGFRIRASIGRFRWPLLPPGSRQAIARGAWPCLVVRSWSSRLEGAHGVLGLFRERVAPAEHLGPAIAK